MTSVDNMFNKAVKLHRQGQFDQAEKIYKKILKSYPGHPEILHLLGLAAYQRGDYKSAIQSIEKAITGNPRNPDFYNNCGEAYRALHNLEAAIACYKKALDLKPDFAEAHNNYGIALKDLGQQGEAISYYRQALLLQPDYAEAHCNLAYLLQKQNLLKESADHYKKALMLKPGLAEAHNNLGNVLKDMDCLEEALAHYQEALRLKPGFAEVYSNMGAVLKMQGRIEEAIVCYEQAINTNVNSASAYYNIGELYERTNQLDKAKSYVEKLLQLQPADPHALRLAATLLRRNGAHEEALEQLMKIDSAACAADAAQDVHFEMGIIYDQMHECDRAFYHFTEGKRLQAGQYSANIHDKNVASDEISKLEALYSKISSSDMLPVAERDAQIQAPVFLIGFPRSGTTLLDQILDSHQRIQVIEEKPILESVIEDISAMSSGYPDAILSLGKDEIKMLQHKYFEYLDRYADRRADSIMVDKFPLNIIHAGLIYSLFPEAKIILALRHPCDVCLSCFMQPFRANAAMVNFFNLEDSAAFYAQVMGLWQTYVKLLPLNYHVLKYESLVSDFQGELEKLLTFLGLDWDARMLDYAEHAKTRGQISTPSYHQVIRPVYQSSRYRWQRYRERLAPVMGILKPYLDAFGYNTD